MPFSPAGSRFSSLPLSPAGDSVNVQPSVHKRLRRTTIAAAPSPSTASDAGSGVASVTAAPPLPPCADAFAFVAPKLFSTSDKSVRSIVDAPSKLPEVHADVVAPKLLRTVERSVKSTLPSALASPAISAAHQDGVRIHRLTAEGGKRRRQNGIVDHRDRISRCGGRARNRRMRRRLQPGENCGLIARGLNNHLVVGHV